MDKLTLGDIKAAMQKIKDAKPVDYFWLEAQPGSLLDRWVKGTWGKAPKRMPKPGKRKPK